jgi:hypothetical protein
MRFVVLRCVVRGGNQSEKKGNKTEGATES